MVTKGSVRRKSKDLFEKVIKLRKAGHSYGEIRKETGLAKSTINNWITYAGLNLSKEHLEIQAVKRAENHIIGTEASKITRAKRREEDIQNFLQSVKKYFDDPFFVAGVMLYEAEGSKGSNNGFSNSDFRLITLYIKFIKRYFNVDENKDLTTRIYIHNSRVDDLARILNFWSKKTGITKNNIRISWKSNIVSARRVNMDYVGQFNIHVKRITHFTSKMLAVSDIILARCAKS